MRISRPVRLQLPGLIALLFALLPGGPVAVPVSAQSAPFAFSLGWSAAARATQAVAWGDVDGDGDLDLASASVCTAPSGCAAAQLYLNTAGRLSDSAGWASAEGGRATSLAWGDVDGDGDLDLAVGVTNEPSRVYRNEGGTLAASAAWRSVDPDRTTSLAWGDVDGDGDLDLATGNDGQPLRLYRNSGQGLESAASWASADQDQTTSLAWGDVDGDGDLDLATGAVGQNRIYRNEGGELGLDAAWTARERGRTGSLAWGDMDGDGDLDLAVGNGGAADNERVYRNESSAAELRLVSAWVSVEGDQTTSVAWGDVDGDGDLDLAVGNGGQSGAPNRVYRNEAGELSAGAAWSSPERDSTTSVAWGDVDGDGDLDLAVGNGEAVQSQANRLYRNDQILLATGAVWHSNQLDDTRSAVWGDADGDGDLDLALGNYQQPKRLYRNEGGQLSAAAIWSSSETNQTTSLAWGDVDADGDLDLAAGNASEPIQLYRNSGRGLEPTAAWNSAERASVTSLAWGDVDGDGDLDLAVGVLSGPSRLYRNEGGQLSAAAVWLAQETDPTRSVAWGDVDGDGDLDLAVGVSGGPSRLYRNEGGQLSAAAVWSSAESDYTQSVAWGDADGDGDLDLATGTIGPNRLYRNEGGRLSAAAVWSSAESDYTLSVAWGDADNDGDLDLAAGNGLFQASRLYTNQGGALSPGATWSTAETGYTQSVAWGDVDGDGDLDLALGGNGRAWLYRNLRDQRGSRAAVPVVRVRGPAPDAEADFYAAPTIQTSGVVAFSYSLAHPQSLPVRRVIGQYSIDGGTWQPARPTAATRLTDLPSSPAGVAQRYEWDVLASGVVGQSDHVRFRLVVLPDLRPRPVAPNATPAVYHYAAYAASSPLFRTRGSQVRVLRAGEPAAGAVVYRLTPDRLRGARPFADRSGRLFQTDAQGYLQGRGEIQIRDSLVALVPISATTTYTVYATSARPTPAGLAAPSVTALGLQTLNVFDSQPLLLFNLLVSIEWDARRDRQFLAQLEYDLRRSSELLYDWSDGQVALGAVTIYQEREQWDAAHIRIYATNRLRPNATQGGIVAQEAQDPQVSGLRYSPGQVRMGVIWNRYGDPGGAFGEDWPRALAHEIGHFALYLDDNYLGRSANGRLTAIDSCPGAMSDPYRDDYSELHPRDGWLPACERTLSHQSSGRSDWETITAFYPWLSAPASSGLPRMRPDSAAQPGLAAGLPIRLFLPLIAGAAGANVGPNTLPLAVTTLRVVTPASPDTTLDVPAFFVAATAGPREAGPGARVFLFPRASDRLIDLGQPALDQVTAHGARLGDRLCVFDLDHQRGGCEAISAGDVQIDLLPRPDWRPDVLITPVTSRTITLHVGGVPAGLRLQARLYPSDTTPPRQIALVAQAGVYQGRFDLAEPALDGHVQIWVDEAAPRREVVTDYALGGNPGRVRSRNVPRGRNPGRVRSRNAPAISADGRVILYTPTEFAAGTFFTIQSATRLPAPPPPGRTLVGQAYWIRASARAPDLAQASLSMGYLNREVSAGAEGGVRAYFWDGASWAPLETERDPIHNEAIAAVRGPGLYALMTSIEVSLAPGWNLVAYPPIAGAPVTEALESIRGAYTTVYSFDGADLGDPWQLYDIDVPAWVNDLGRLEPGQGYWINATRAITLYLAGGVGAAGLAAAPTATAVPTPPATLYGLLPPLEGLAPRAGLRVVALVGASVCGQAVTSMQGGQAAFVVDVFAATPGPRAGCGAPDRMVRLLVEGRALGEMLWDNSRPRRLE